VVKLRERRQREREGLMIIEGYRELRRAIEGRVSIKTLYHCADWFQGTNEPGLMEAARAAGARLTAVSKAVFEKMAYRDRPEGLLALASLPPHDFKAFLDYANQSLPAEPFLLVTEAIEKPGNLGTMLRSSDAAGVDAVLVADPVTDLFNPNVIRASLGTVFTKPVFQVTSAELRDWLREQKIKSFAATPVGEHLYTDANMSPPCALVIGSEQFGLSEIWMNESDCRVRIPMLGAADSLNAAQAGTLMLFEVVRRRGSTTC
jgi:TrmH family RNA methyltransferase